LTPTPTPAEPPAVAVYVTGGPDINADIKDALGVFILDGLVNSGLYRAVERSEKFLAAVEQEHVAQRSGAIDDNQIREIGKRSGVQFVCVASITPAIDKHQISARIIDVETAAITASGVGTGPLNSLDDLKRGTAAVIYNMIGVRVSINKDFELLTEREETILEQKIEQTIQQTIHSTKLTNKRSFWIGSGISLAGAGLVAYGLYENGNVVNKVDHGNFTGAEDAVKSRNRAYAIGAAVLLIGVTIVSIQIIF
jgi:hypothetical protein